MQKYHYGQMLIAKVKVTAQILLLSKADKLFDILLSWRNKTKTLKMMEVAEVAFVQNKKESLYQIINEDLMVYLELSRIDGKVIRW